MDTPDDLDRLAADWIALWESEVTAAAQDREAAEAWAAGMALVAAFWRAQAAGMAALAKWAPPHEPPRPAPAATAPAAGDGAGDGGDGDALRARIAELERRLAALERQPGGGGADRGRPRPRRDHA